MDISDICIFRRLTRSQIKRPQKSSFSLSSKSDSETDDDQPTEKPLSLNPLRHRRAEDVIRRFPLEIRQGL